MNQKQISGKSPVFNRICSLCSYGVTLLAGALLFYLTLLSLFSTSYLSDKEAMFYVSDHPFFTILAMAVLLILLVVGKRNHLLDKWKLRKVNITFLLAVWFVLLAWFVLATMQFPIYDQNKIFQAAKQIMHMDFSAYLPGGYVERYSNQQGIVLLFAGIFHLFGEGNHIAIQLLNAAALVVTGACIYRICRYLWNKTESGLAVAAFMLFLPLWGYVTFVYGTLYSTAFAMAALLILLNYIEKEKWYTLLLSSVLIAVSILIKMNSIILLIAMVILLIVSAIERRKPKLLIGVVVLVAVTMLGNFGLETYVNHMTDGLYSKGIPRSGHIAMGLQESGTRAPGWYNGYIENTYEETGYDYEVMDGLAKENIRESMQNFLAHPTYAIGFFVRKTASQWNEPTFESIFIQQNRNSEVKLPKVISAAIGNTTFHRVLVELFDIFQSMIYFGAFAYLIMSRKEKGFLRLSFAVMFLGGFFFHTIWEASSQYTVVYFILLIPYAVIGFLRLAESFSALWTQTAEKGLSTELLRAPLIRMELAFLLLILVLALSGQNIVTSVILLNRDDSTYAEAESIVRTKPSIPNGRYQICPADASGMVLTVESSGRDDELPACIAPLDTSKPQKMTVFYENDAYTLRFAHSGKVLDVRAAGTEPGTIVQQYEGNGDVSQQWEIKENEDGSYTIYYTDTLVLTADPNTARITVETDNGAAGQKWMIQK